MKIPFNALNPGKPKEHLKKYLPQVLILSILSVIIIFAILDIPNSYEFPYALLFLNTLFLGIIPLIIALISFRVYVQNGSSIILLIGAGVLIFGLGSIAAGWVNPLPGGSNMTVTIHNTCACLSSFFILIGAILSLSGAAFGGKKGSIRTGMGMYGGIIGFVILFSLATISGAIPPFFVSGSGPTLLRQVVLENAFVFYVFSYLFFYFLYLRKKSVFFFWISLSFALISLGLLAIFLQPSVGSLIGWVGRASQYIGCVIALYAILIVRRSASEKGIRIEDIISHFFIDAELNYKSLVDTATDAIITFGEDFQILLWNRAAERMFGYTRDEALSLSFSVCVAPDQFSIVEKYIHENNDKSQFPSLTSPSIEIICSRKDRTLFPVDISISQRLQNGNLICTGILRDLSERKIEQEALRMSELKYHSLFNHMLNGFAYCKMVYDEQGLPVDLVYLDVNTAFEHLTGLSDVVGRRITEVIPGVKESSQELLEIYGRVAMSGTPETFEFDFKPLNIWLYISVFSPEKEYFVAVFENITERKHSVQALQISHETLEQQVCERTSQLSEGNTRLIEEIKDRKRIEQALAESEKRLQAIVDNAVIGLCHISPEGRFLFANNHAAHILGYDTKEDLIQSITDISTQIYQNPHQREEIKQLLCERGIMENVEVPCFHRDGHTIWLSFNGKLVRDRQGAILYHEGTIQDVTHRKQAEQAIYEANQKLRLLTGLTRHDIFNQISAVQILLDMAIQTSDRVKITEYLSQAQEASEQITATIGFTREYEDFGIVSSGWYRICPIIESAKSEIHLGEISFENQIPEDLEVYADPIMRKVFTTLLENAIRHGGEITSIRFSSAESEQNLVIICEDDGVGIPSEEKQYIFDHGFGKNTGIGLFLSREILSITGLSIRECGEEGEGARFEISVPPGKHRIKPKGWS